MFFVNTRCRVSMPNILRHVRLKAAVHRLLRLGLSTTAHVFMLLNTIRRSYMLVFVYVRSEQSIRKKCEIES